MVLRRGDGADVRDVAEEHRGTRHTDAGRAGDDAGGGNGGHKRRTQWILEQRCDWLRGLPSLIFSLSLFAAAAARPHVVPPFPCEKSPETTTNPC